ncbi:MAG: hypothetical protein C4521_09385 [Actinobacteria bacterium]|nr:MAG: hypothetical protein C4521_09385 [Actinomycetota bacterium]
MDSTLFDQRRQQVRLSDWVRAIIYFLTCPLPSDPQRVHLAFMKLQPEYPEPLGRFRFVPDPVLPRSERLAAILSSLQLSKNTKKANPDMPLTELTKEGRKAVEQFVLPKFSPDQKQVCEALAHDLETVWEPAG